MKIVFKDEDIETICSVFREATRKYGKDNAKKITLHLSRLQAAPKLEDMRNLPGRIHELHYDREFQLSLDLKGALRLIFEPVGETLLKADGGLDWRMVTTIRMLSVEDTHE